MHFTQHSFVLRARGIYKNWNLPIAYFLSDKRVENTQLFAVGLKPKAIVCDQGPNNQGDSRLSGIIILKTHILCE